AGVPKPFVPVSVYGGWLGAPSYGLPPFRALLRHIGPRFRCRGRRSRWSRCAAAPRARSESPTEHGESAGAEAPVAPAAFLQGLTCVRPRSLFTFFTGNRSSSGCTVAMF